MFHVDPAVRGMALVRMLSASIEITAAFLMLRAGRVETAIGINAALGMVGPVLFAIVSTIGIVSLAGHLSFQKVGFIMAGVLLVLWGAMH